MIALDRRQLLMGAFTVSLAGLFVPRSAWSQTSALPPSDPQALAAFVTNEALWLEMIADVVFLQSWRLELAPVGDERSGSFPTDMIQFRSNVFRAQRQIPIQLPNVDLSSLRREFLSAFSDRSPRYESFLREIGVSGRAAARLTRSMFVFANLSFAAVSTDQARNAQRRSFFWPFC